jgi:molybdopterin/thiamine biosynthesis adenylyltransferase
MTERNEMNLLRYCRQTMIPEFGEESQKRISTSSVAVIGIGGVGSLASLYLAANGVGKIALIDDDIVELHNLHRQILYREPELGEKKAGLAQKSLQSLNSDIEIIKHECKITEANALSLLTGYDLVLEGSDNFSTRFVVNDACVDLNIPFISVSVDRFYGQVTLYNYQGSKNLRDLYPEIKPDYPFNVPSTRGILGVVPGMVALIAVTEALKFLGHFGSVHHGKITFDALQMKMMHFSL